MRGGTSLVRRATRAAPRKIRWLYVADASGLVDEQPVYEVSLDPGPPDGQESGLCEEHAGATRLPGCPGLGRKKRPGTAGQQSGLGSGAWGYCMIGAREGRSRAHLRGETKALTRANKPL